MEFFPNTPFGLHMTYKTKDQRLSDKQTKKVCLNRALKQALFEGLSSINKKDLLQVFSFRMRYRTFWKTITKNLKEFSTLWETKHV